MELGAYIQIFKDDGKARHTLENFRKHYPDSPVYIVSDNGDNFVDLAKQYNCRYVHDNINTGSGAGGWNKQQLLLWLQRMKHAFEYCNTEYILYLEDDVLIRNVIKIDKSWHIAGLHVNPIPDYFRQYPHNTTVYGACGGSIYKTQTFLNLYSSMVDFINDEFDHIERVLGSRIFGCLDLTMPVLYMIHGFDYSENTEQSEPTKCDWRNSHHPIIHLMDKEYSGVDW